MHLLNNLLFLKFEYKVLAGIPEVSNKCFLLEFPSRSYPPHVTALIPALAFLCGL